MKSIRSSYCIVVNVSLISLVFSLSHYIINVSLHFGSTSTSTHLKTHRHYIVVDLNAGYFIRQWLVLLRKLLLLMSRPSMVPLTMMLKAER